MVIVGVCNIEAESSAGATPTRRSPVEVDMPALSDCVANGRYLWEPEPVLPEDWSPEALTDADWTAETIAAAAWTSQSVTEQTWTAQTDPSETWTQV
jgi:hypothetical protein